MQRSAQNVTCTFCADSNYIAIAGRLADKLRKNVIGLCRRRMGAWKLLAEKWWDFPNIVKMQSGQM